MNANVIATMRWRDKHSHHAVITVAVVWWVCLCVCVWLTLSACRLCFVKRKWNFCNQNTSRSEKQNEKSSFEVQQSARNGAWASTYYSLRYALHMRCDRSRVNMNMTYSSHCQCNRFHMQISSQIFKFQIIFNWKHMRVRIHYRWHSIRFEYRGMNWRWHI